MLHERHLKRHWNEEEACYKPDLSLQRIRFVFECAPGDTAGEMRRDVPVVWPDRLTREYTVRFIHEELIELTPEVAP